MNSKWHLYISFIKSAVRIIACALSLILQSLTALAAGMLIAELLGVLEEVGDKR